MPEVYSRTLSLGVPDGADLQAEFLATLREWVGERWPSGEPWLQVDSPRRFSTRDGSIFRWEPFTCGADALHEFTWRHAHQGDPAVTWATQISLVVLAGQAKLAVRVWNTGPEPEMPGFLATTRPRFLLSLVRRFACSTLGTRLSLEPRLLKSDEITTLVRYELLDPERLMPILLLTPEQDGSFATEPQQLLDEFLSLAELVVIPRPDLTFHLTRELGDKALSCFNGAARLYMPRFSKKDNPFRHPLLLPRRLGDSRVRLRWAQSLALLSVQNARPIPDILRLRDLRAVSDHKRHEALAQAFEGAKRDRSEAQDWRSLAETYAEDNQRLQAEIERLQEETTEQENIIKALRYRLSQVSSDSEGTPEEGFSFVGSSVAEAVEFAQAAYEEDLRILDSAVAAAEESPYHDPLEISQALNVLAALARNLREGPLGKNLKDFFKEQGLKYRAGISETTSAALRKQHEFVDGDRTYCCYEHLNFGTSYDPTYCARIYFTTKLDERVRIVIGHVGRHLDTPTTT